MSAALRRVGGEALLDALPRLRARDAAAWGIVASFLRGLRATRGDEGEDVAHDALIAIVLHADDLRSPAPGAAVRWCARIAQRKRIDVARARGPRWQLVDAAAVELPVRDDGRHLDDRALDVLVETIEDAIDRYVNGLTLPAETRMLRRHQARAALHRVLGADTAAIVGMLALGRRFRSDRLAKWVERGRPILIAALERLAWDHDGEVREVAFALREIALVPWRHVGARPRRRRSATELQLGEHQVTARADARGEG